MPHYTYGGWGSGGGGGSSVPFDILSFTNNVNLVETGTTINTVTLRWTYKGAPDSQSIDNGIGSLPVDLRSYIVSQNISSDITFTLSAVAGTTSLTKSTTIELLDPVFIGSVFTDTPVESEILAMDKQIKNDVTFDYDFIIADKRTAIAIPQYFNPISEIRESMFGLNVMNEFNIYNNVPLNVLSGVVPYKIYILKDLQNTDGIIQSLQFVW